MKKGVWGKRRIKKGMWKRRHRKGMEEVDHPHEGNEEGRDKTQEGKREGGGVRQDTYEVMGEGKERGKTQEERGRLEGRGKTRRTGGGNRREQTMNDRGDGGAPCPAGRACRGSQHLAQERGENEDQA
jgi:hypothetical protein